MNLYVEQFHVETVVSSLEKIGIYSRFDQSDFKVSASVSNGIRVISNSTRPPRVCTGLYREGEALQRFDVILPTGFFSLFDIQWCNGPNLHKNVENVFWKEGNQNYE